jgi:predicted TIM-barrel fold metal-dependent hydrolase
MAVAPIAHDPVRAVEEIRWARAHGLKGIFIGPMWGAHPPYHSPVYEPVWSVCEELDMPINLHGGAAPTQDYGDLPGCIGIFITEVAWWSVRPVWFLIWSGVFERHPKLKLVITELGASWVPEIKALMDQRFEANHFTAKLAPYRTEMRMKPSEYFDRNCWVGASVTSRADVENRHAIGVDNLMWGSDYPHPEGAWPYTARFLAESFHDLPDEDVRKMLGLTAAKVYGFDVEALAPLVERIGKRPEDLALPAPERRAAAAR